MSFVQLLGWHDYFVPPSLQLFSEGCYLIFNCGENSQRFRLSNKLGLAKIRYLFLTNLSAHSFLGLPGLILSLDGCNTSRVTVFGPKPLKKILETLLSTFLELKIEVTITEVDSPAGTELLKLNSLSIFGFTYESQANATFTLKPVHNTNVGYFVKFATVPGTFKPDIAEKFGVQKGPDFGRLKRGLDVTLTTGEVLRPEQVCGEPTAGRQLLIVDGPVDLKPAVRALTAQTNVSVDRELLLHVFYLHTGGPESARTQVLCNRTDEDFKYVAFPPYYQRNALHHSIFPSLFPNLSPLTLERAFAKPFEDLFGLTLEDIRAGICGAPANHAPLTRFYVHPPKRVGAANAQIYVDRADCLSRDLNARPEAPARIDHEVDLSGPTITFLGTGCSVPSVYRNVSSTLVQIYEDYAVLLDAGEGTVLQILYTCADFENFVKKLLSIRWARVTLRVIFISHSHADHHLGLYHVLALQHKFRTDGAKTLVVCSDVILVGAADAQSWLETYDGHLCRLSYDSLVPREDMDTMILLEKSTLKLSFFRVDHIFDSFGLRLTHEVGSIVYSGDTRPSENLVRHAQGADILIHEATFTDEYRENAIRNLHSTVSEAIETAVKCNAKNLFVTHFSQRFQSVSRAHAQIPNDYAPSLNLVMASDLMTVPIRGLERVVPDLKRFNSALSEALT